MSIGSRAGVLRPKQPTWALATLGAGVVVLLAYLALSWSAPWKPGRIGGLAAGIAAAALFVNGALYPARRRLRSWPLGTALRWLQLHIYGSMLAVVLVLIHMGFRWPVGTLGWLLFVLTIWTAVTGIIGVYLQKSLAIALATHLRAEVIYERIPELVEDLAREADIVMAQAPELLIRVYTTEIRPLMQRPMMQWGYVMDMTAGRARQEEVLSRIVRYLDDVDRGRIVALQDILNDKFDLDVHMSVQRALRTWIVAHVPAAMVLMGLLAVHVFAVVYF